MGDKNSPIEVDASQGNETVQKEEDAQPSPPPPPKISSLASNHLLNYDDYDGYLTSNDDGDDEDGDGDTVYHNHRERILENAIYDDDAPGFIAQMELLFGLDDSLEPGETVKPNAREPMLCPSRILRRICVCGALACVNSLLQGKTCVYVDLNVPFDEGNYPLHLVASNQNYDLVKLFLYYGAQTDVLDDFVGERKLPLNASLERLNKHIYFDHWSPAESIYKLIIMLCLPQMKIALDTNRLLALHTEDVSEIFIDYAKKGKLIEMVVLLMVANDRIIAPRTFKSKDGGIVEGGGMTILNLINDRGKVQEYHNVNMGKLAQMCNTGESASITLTLLKLFEAAGDAIRSYIHSRPSHVPKERVVNDVASILKESAFVLKETDIDLSNIDCESDHIKKATGTSENRTAYGPWAYGLMVLPFRRKSANEMIKGFGSFYEATDFMSKDKDIGLSNIDRESYEINEATESSENITTYEPKMRPSMFSDRCRHFKPPLAWPIVPAVHSMSRPRCIMMANGYVRKFSSSEFFKLQNNQVKGEKNAMRRLMNPSIPRNGLASLAMSFKRGLRHV